MAVLRTLLLLAVSSMCFTSMEAADSCESGCPVYIRPPPPVCGDGKEFMDECRAKCGGAKVITPGQCPTGKPSCICPKIYRPVCGSNGVTYSNRCLALCAGVKRFTPGPCCYPCKLLCINTYDPVCADGVTYKNRCMTLCLCPPPKRVVPGECKKDGR